MPRSNTTRSASTSAQPRCVGLALTAAAFAALLLPVAFGQHSHPGGEHMSTAPMRAPQPSRSYAPQAPRPYRPYNAQPQHYPVPVQPGPPSSWRPNSPVFAGPAGNWRPPAVSGPHLGGWLQNHQGEPMSAQQNALRNEPGFNRLPPQQQQRLLNRLQTLDAMPPTQRQRWIGRNENMERLAPDRREQVRGSAQELGAMDPARKQQMSAAFRVLRDMPPAQRDHVLNSPAYRSMYSDHERQILGNLLSVEPYQPR